MNLTLQIPKKSLSKAFLKYRPLKTENENHSNRFYSVNLESKKQGKDTISLEDQIDRMVYELYGLTEEEIGVVEGN
jgi:adenine-specific DNA-methyltransferase